MFLIQDCNILFMQRVLRSEQKDHLSQQLFFPLSSSGRFVGREIFIAAPHSSRGYPLPATSGAYRRPSASRAPILQRIKRPSQARKFNDHGLYRRIVQHGVEVTDYAQAAPRSTNHLDLAVTPKRSPRPCTIGFSIKMCSRAFLHHHAFGPSRSLNQGNATITHCCHCKAAPGCIQPVSCLPSESPGNERLTVVSSGHREGPALPTRLVILLCSALRATVDRITTSSLATVQAMTSTWDELSLQYGTDVL